MEIGQKEGFIIDVPNALIMTAKGDQSILTADSGEVTFGGDSVAITGGWSFFDLIEIDTKSTIEVNLSNSAWTMVNMQMTSGGEVKTGNAEHFHFGEIYQVATNQITLPFVAVAGSVRLNGMKEVASAPAAANEFQVTIGATDTTVAFFTGTFTDGTELSPVFRVEVADSEILTVKTTDTPTSGQVILQFPIYGDKEGVKVEGYGQITIFKGKIQKQNKIGGSYKSASKFDTVIKGLDPRRPDKKMFEIAYIPVVA